MIEFIAVLFFVCLALCVYWIVRFFIRVLFGLGQLGSTPIAQQRSASSASSPGMTAEEEGDVHNGPHGYSPATAYPETQYGSDFNPDAEWNHEEQ